MSHDQRPAKMRVVQDATRTPGTRRDDPPAAAGVALRAGGGVAGTPDAANNATAGKALPLFQAGIFLLACVIGGVAFAIVRPF